MRPHSNQSNGRGEQRHGGHGNGNRHSSGRPPYGGNREQGNHREHREHRGGREQGAPGYGAQRTREHRGENRGGGNGPQKSHGFRPDRRPYREQGEHRGRENREHRGEQRSPQGPRGPRSSWVEVTGRGAEDAIQEALRRFNVGRQDLNLEVVEEGSRGFLGIGAKPARVKVALKSGAVMPFAEGVLTRLLRAMGLPDTVQGQKDPDGNPVLNIQGPSSGTLIGRHGHTLESLQYLVSKIVQRMTGDEHVMIVVDVENYLERQRDKLKELALGLAQKAKETGAEVPMRPMNSKDRRVVHLALKENEHVTTESRGEGLRRRVVIVPKVKAAAPVAAGEAVEAAPGNSAEPLPYSPEAMAASDALGNVMPTEPDLPDDIGNH